MSRHITALAAVVVLTAGGAAAATVITANDDGARTITITSDDGVGIRRATDSLDKLIAKGAKVDFDIADRDKKLRAQLERTSAGLVTGRIEVRP